MFIMAVVMKMATMFRECEMSFCAEERRQIAARDLSNMPGVR
jgi:hypothetical protein